MEVNQKVHRSESHFAQPSNPYDRDDPSNHQSLRAVDVFLHHRVLCLCIIVPSCMVRFDGQSLPSPNLTFQTLKSNTLFESMIQQVHVKSDFAPQGVRRRLLALISFAVIAFTGCAQLRLPAIDSTGRSIFAPAPTTTTLALPGSAGEGIGCFRNLRNRIGSTVGGFQWPSPVFDDPAEPPPCIVPEPVVPESSIALGQSNEPYVPSEPCGESCKAGPPAVLYGQETQLRNVLSLPDRGKRGCILLSPQKIVAPVGGEVVLLSGICGDDGYLQVGEPLEWMLTPDSVGTLIQVGDDDPGFLHRLARLKKAEKKDGSFAHGVTSTKRTLITRGNLDPRDDVQLEKGQTWVTLSSPSEGTSRVTVLAPESECWDHRKATATVYWVDARWQFPNSQTVGADTPVQLSTRVTRSEGRLPARNWKVRYEILEPGLATFAGTDGSTVVEAKVDENGNAIAELIPTPGMAGTTPVDIQVIRPGGELDNIPTMTLGRGQTYVTWSAPQLAIEAAGPEVATFNAPVSVAAVVKNAGDQPTKNVRVTMGIPPGVKAASSDGFAQNLPSAIVWEIPEIPPKTQLDLLATVTPQNTADLVFEARADNNLVASDRVRIDVYRPSLTLKVAPEKERYETGEPVTFNIDVTNTGERALQNVQLDVLGDGAMVDQAQGRSGVSKPKDGPLNPGETWPVAVTFIPTDSGRRCIQVNATASAGQRAESQSCVTVINPAPVTPAMNVRLERRDEVQMGATPAFLRGIVTNTGEVPLSDVRVTMTHDPQLQLIGATADGLDLSQIGQYMVGWNIPTLGPNETRTLEMEVRALQPNPRSQVIMTSRSKEGAFANDSYTFAIVPPPAPATGTPGGIGGGEGNPFSPSDRQPDVTLPEALPTPELPAPAPIPAPGGFDPFGSGGTPNDPNPRSPNSASPGDVGGAPSNDPLTGTGLRLRLDTLDNPARVNDEIRYRLIVTNDTNQTDSAIRVRFRLPDGVTMERGVVTTNPQLGQFRPNAGVIETDIRTLEAGESVEYGIILRGNQPQEFDFRVEADSQLTPNPVRAIVPTKIIP